MGRRPCIRGLRVMVGTTVGLLATGHEPTKCWPPTRTLNATTSARRWPTPHAQRGAGSHGRLELKLLIDMNLSPRWIETLADAGIEARHWSRFGDGAASTKLKSRTNTEDASWAATTSTPGEHLAELLDELEIGASRRARAIDVPTRRINDIVRVLPIPVVVREQKVAIFRAWASVSRSRNQTSSPFDRKTNGTPSCSA